jgi:hypothetical protein
VVGDQLHSLALHDRHGKVWDYSKNRTGKVLLFYFWHSGNEEALTLLPALKNLSDSLGSDGLEVVGIAYEEGTEAQQASSLRWVVSRYQIRYPLLLAGGTLQTCPAAREFDIVRLPTLVLVNDRGKIVWRSKRELDERQLLELRQAITQQLAAGER